MPTLLAIALASSAAVSGPTQPSCSWDRPGVNPFMGNVVAAVDRYTDIPVDVRARLKSRMAKRQYDEIATIRRDSVIGKHRYAPEITDMHFGQGTVCRTVTRNRWPEQMVERGLVYCESGHCIIVPTVCRNVSRIQRLEDKRAAADEGGAPAAAGSGGGGGGAAVVDVPAQVANAEPSGELEFDAPGAGGASFEDVAQGRVVTGGTGLLNGPPPLAGPGSSWSYGSPIAAMPNYGGGGGGGFIGVPGLPSTPRSGDEGPSGSGPVVTGPLLPGTPPGPTAPLPESGPGTPPLPPPLPLPPLPLPPLGGPTLPPGPVTAVPEPGNWALLGLGLAALAWRLRRH